MKLKSVFAHERFHSFFFFFFFCLFFFVCAGNEERKRKGKGRWKGKKKEIVDVLKVAWILENEGEVWTKSTGRL
jgi:hypothetical protein